MSEAKRDLLAYPQEIVCRSLGLTASRDINNLFKQEGSYSLSQTDRYTGTALFLFFENIAPTVSRWLVNEVSKKEISNFGLFLGRMMALSAIDITSTTLIALTSDNGIDYIEKRVAANVATHLGYDALTTAIRSTKGIVANRFRKSPLAAY